VSFDNAGYLLYSCQDESMVRMRIQVNECCGNLWHAVGEFRQREG
jgi:hypothetical protein